MARKRYSDEDILKLLREIELKLAEGGDVQSACRAVGVSDATYYNWRRRFGGMDRAKLSVSRDLEKLAQACLIFFFRFGRTEFAKNGRWPPANMVMKKSHAQKLLGSSGGGRTDNSKQDIRILQGSICRITTTSTSWQALFPGQPTAS